MTRFLAVLLCVVLVFATSPFAAFAECDGDGYSPSPEAVDSWLNYLQNNPGCPRGPNEYVQYTSGYDQAQSQNFYSDDCAGMYSQMYAQYGGVFPQQLADGVWISSPTDLQNYCNAKFALWYIYNYGDWNHATAASKYQTMFDLINQGIGEAGGPTPLFGGLAVVAYLSDKFTNSMDETYSRACMTLEQTTAISTPEALMAYTVGTEGLTEQQSQAWAYLKLLQKGLDDGTYTMDSLGQLGYNVSENVLNFKPTLTPGDIAYAATKVTVGSGKTMAYAGDALYTTLGAVSDGKVTSDEAISIGKKVIGTGLKMGADKNSLDGGPVAGQSYSMWSWSNYIYSGLYSVFNDQLTSNPEDAFWTNGEPSM